METALQLAALLLVVATGLAIIIILTVVKNGERNL